MGLYNSFEVGRFSFMQSWLTHTSRLANSQASASNAARWQWKTGIIGATKRSIVLKIHFVYLLINSSWFKNRKNLQPTKYITRKLNPIKHKKLFLNNVVWAIFGIEMLAKTLVNLANASLSRGKLFGGQGATMWELWQQFKASRFSDYVGTLATI